ncbi:repair protein rad1/Rec1/rad17 [Nitzschia inconspicua]|uniref:Repair protein rad1/Rec1/rad17 n=1 Tax=Nitzschia inconspicua TaxID=303405 RepID=A0A9K3PGZ1_9STRA|nr:repair protein rad1/Rec1/rad17 [Nitzschia inconspicua]
MAVYTPSPSSDSDSERNAGNLRHGRQRLSSGLDSAVSFTGSSAAVNKIQKNRSTRSPTTNRSHRSHHSHSQEEEEEEEAHRSIQGGNEQNQKEQEEEMEDDIMFLCRCENPKVLVEILQSFSKTGLSSSSSQHRKSSSTRTTQGSTTANITQTQRRSTVIPTQPMTIFCNANAITIHSQSSNKQFQASMELPCTFFQHYQLAHHPNYNDHEEDDDKNTETDTFDFTIHWHTFLQCLTVLLTTANSSVAPFGSNNNNNNNSTSSTISSTLTMAYHASTELLRLEWETFHQHNHHQSIMATAAIPGLETPEAEEAAELSAAFQQSPIAARWLSTSTCLKEAKTELELVPGATLVQVEFWQEQPNKSNHLGFTTKPQPCLRLFTKGYSSQVSVEIPGSIEFSNISSDTLYYSQQQQQPRKPHKLIHTYTLTHWRQALQPLDMAKETCISVNQQGILAVQHSLTVHRGNTSRNLEEQDDDGTLAVFCDFLLLPMVEQLQEEYDDETDKQPNDDDDDHCDSYTESSGLKTQSSHNNRHGTDDEATTHSYPARHRSTARTNCNDVDNDDDDDDDDRRPASLPIGSDDEDEDEDDETNEQPVLKRSPMLFPSLTGAVHDTPHSTLTQETMESSVLRHQRRRDQRKRHRRASNERQQQQHRLATHQESQHAHYDHDDDDDDDDSSVNLLQDSPPNNAPQKQQSHFYSSDENDRNEEDRHYCSSPEIVYGES